MKRKKICLWAAAFAAATIIGCGENSAYQQARRDLSQEAYEEALQGFETAIEAGDHVAESCRGAGIAQLKLGNYEEAIQYFEQAVSQGGLDRGFQRDVLSYEATAQYKDGQYDQAVDTCESLLKISDQADSYYLAGRAALAVDDYEKAQEYFDQAADKDKKEEMALQIYEAYLEQDMEADGTKYLEQVLAVEARSARDHCERGRIYYYMEDYENAQKELTEAMDRNDSEAMLVMGQVYLAQNDVDSARAMFQEYKEKEEEHMAAGYNGLVLCDLADRDYTSALENVQKGLETAEGDSMQDLLFNEVVVYEKSHDFKTAQEKAEEYLQLFPDDEKMQREKEFLDSRVS